MKAFTRLAALFLLCAASAACAQVTTDVMGMHSLGPGTTSPISGARPDACAYCHAPHSGLNVGLWNQKLTTKGYTTYTSTTEKNSGTQPTIGYSTNQCLSCHDGSIAVGTTVAYGSVTMHGAMNPEDVFNGTMQSSHPFSLATPLQDNIDLAASLTTSGTTLDPTHAVRLSHGNVECISCHDPHVQSKDLVSQKFLVRDSSNGQMCLACHDPARQQSGKVNPLADWTTSAHAIATNAKVSAQANVGPYATVAGNACIGCHAPHNAQGPAQILRGQNEQDCLACHNGSTNVSPMPKYANVFAEYGAGKVGHPFPQGTNQHDANEPALLQNNRHATCVDCHNSHGSEIVTIFPPAPLLRVSQKNIAGIATDGTTILTPAVNQYENCLRCHGTSSGKQVQPVYGYFPVRAVSAGDQLNLIPQFADTSTSSHPVTHVRKSILPQPSLRNNMLQIDGITQGRAMGTQIFCTDCHNSDDNREFGGDGASGPHGSRWQHILERRYEFNKAITPGGLLTNLFPTPDTTAAGPYALCGKCHDLPNQILKNTSWNKHASHVGTDGFSCATCHTAHGMGAVSGNFSGERLVNFDVNLVASNKGLPISYNRTANTCVLVCHQVAHNPDGSVTKSAMVRSFGSRR